MTLQFDVDVAGTKDSDQLIDSASSFFDATLLQSCRKRALRTAGKADEAVGVFFEFFCADCAFAFFGAQFHFGDQAAEILITGARCDEKRKAKRFVIPSGARNP